MEGLLAHLKSGEVIAFPNFDLPFFMTTDASGYGLGAVLYQAQGGKDRVIAYASRTLTDAETNYNLHSGKIEFLALKWAVTERFSDYLRYGTEAFTVYTDNNPLTYVLTSAKLNATGLRWVADLAEFNFVIKYRPGKSNSDADGLSRRPMEISEMKRKCTESVEPSSVAAVMVNSQSMAGGSVVALCNAEICELSAPVEESSFVGKEEMIEAQKVDPVIGPVLQYVRDSVRPTRKEWSQLPGGSKVLMRSFPKLKLVNGVLFRQTAKYRQIVLPQKFHETVYVELHVKMAHVGAEKVVELARQRFYWPRMDVDIINFVRKKCRCIVTKKPNVEDRAPLIPIQATYPFEMIEIDYLHLDKCQGGFEYVMIVVDHFTRFAQFYATRNKSSQAAAAKLWNEFIPIFGLPKKIHHDKGGEWNSLLWKELHRYTGVRASNTTPYNPHCDGMVERLNRTAINMLKAIPESQKKMWKNHLPKLAFAYNSCVQKTTGFSPFFLMFGRESKLPVDTMFGLDEGDVKRKSHRQFVDDWKTAMEQAYALANENIANAADYNKMQYDRKVHGAELQVGDQVLIRNMRERGEGTGKLVSHWERQVFKVVEKKPELPVYVIENLNKKDDVRTVHRNLLLECNQLPSEVFQSEKESGRKLRKNKTQEPKPNEIRSGKEGEGMQLASREDKDVDEEDLEMWDEEVCEQVASLGQDKVRTVVADEEVGNRVGEMVEDSGALEVVSDVSPVSETDDDDAVEVVPDTSPVSEAEESHVVEELETVGPGSEVDEVLPGLAHSQMETAGESASDSDDVVLLENDDSTLPVRTSVRERRPAVKFTYDVPGTPKFADVKFTGDTGTHTLADLIFTWDDPETTWLADSS